MIRLIKLLVVTTILSYLAVWLSNRPGKVEIIWQEYLIQTNVIGIFFLFVISILTVLFIYFFFSKVKNIPKDISYVRKEKKIILTNQALDDVALGLFVGDNELVEKNSRKLKKYLNNHLFSTFMLFNSSLNSENLIEAKKYLNVLKNIPKADYLSKRGEIVVALKEDDFDYALNALIKFKKNYENDVWISDKLSMIYVQRKEWKMALNALEKLNLKDNSKLKNLKAILYTFLNKDIEGSLKISDKPFYVLNEAIKKFLENQNIKGALSLIEKSWPNLQCFKLIDTFLKHENKGISDSLKRHKFLSKVLRKSKNSSHETNFALAFSAFEAKIWGESKKYLDLIPKSNWDKRVTELYKEISKQSPKINLPSIPNQIIDEPYWVCESCHSKVYDWQLVCKNCNNVNSLVWSKSKKIKETKPFFLKNTLRHFPKMN